MAFLHKSILAIMHLSFLMSIGVLSLPASATNSPSKIKSEGSEPILATLEYLMSVSKSRIAAAEDYLCFFEDILNGTPTDLELANKWKTGFLNGASDNEVTLTLKNSVKQIESDLFSWSNSLNGLKNMHMSITMATSAKHKNLQDIISFNCSQFFSTYFRAFANGNFETAKSLDTMLTYLRNGKISTLQYQFRHVVAIPHIYDPGQTDFNNEIGLRSIDRMHDYQTLLQHLYPYVDTAYLTDDIRQEIASNEYLHEMLESGDSSKILPSFETFYSYLGPKPNWETWPVPTLFPKVGSDLQRAAIYEAVEQRAIHHPALMVTDWIEKMAKTGALKKMAAEQGFTKDFFKRILCKGSFHENAREYRFFGIGNERILNAYLGVIFSPMELTQFLEEQPKSKVKRKKKKKSIPAPEAAPPVGIEERLAPDGEGAEEEPEMDELPDNKDPEGTEGPRSGLLSTSKTEDHSLPSPSRTEDQPLQKKAINPKSTREALPPLYSTSSSSMPRGSSKAIDSLLSILFKIDGAHLSFNQKKFMPLLETAYRDIWMVKYQVPDKKLDRSMGGSMRGLHNLEGKTLIIHEPHSIFKGTAGPRMLEHIRRNFIEFGWTPDQFGF